MRTAVTEMFGIDVPILAFSHCRDVVAAVTKAGGMGVLGAAAHTPEQLEVDLDWIEAEIGDRPYGVDLIVPARYEGSDEGGLSIEAVQGLIPTSNPAALLAYYCAVFSLIPVFGLLLGPAALVLGVVGRSRIQSDPRLPGRAHAWIGILLGGLVSLAYV